MIRIVAHTDHTIQPFTHRLDVSDEDYLLESILQSAEQLDDVEASRFVE